MSSIDPETGMQHHAPAFNSLTSIPPELLPRIFTHLQSRDALSLGLTAYHFSPSLPSQIWRNIDLSLHPYYGHLPYILPAYPEGTDEYATWVENEAEKAEARRGEALRRKIKGLMLKGGEREWGWVESVSMMPSVGAVGAMLQALEMASGSLQSLIIRAPHFPPFGPRSPPMAIKFETHTGLEFLSLHCRLAFPNLLCLKLSSCPFRYAEWVPLLCQACPGLVELDVDFPSQVKSPSSLVKNFPTFSRPTKIARMRVSFEARRAMLSTGGYFQPIPTILALLQHCPVVEQLALRLPAATIPESTYRMMGILSNYEKLRDLYLPSSGSIGDALALLTNDGGVFPELRRVVVPGYWDHVFRSLPACPKLEVIHFVWIPEGLAVIQGRRFADPAVPSLLSMTPFLAVQLRASPKLHSIYRRLRHRIRNEPEDLDMLEHVQVMEQIPGSAWGVIRSFHHGGRTVLHARFLMQETAVQDFALPIGPAPKPMNHYDLHYEAADGSNRAICFERRQCPSWQHLTDLDGLAVPLEVIERMREVEGVSEAEWQGRGIEVGAEAWKVLTDWEEAVLRERDEAGFGEFLSGHA